MRVAEKEKEVAQCKRCGRVLTDPLWIAVGYGMECFRWMVRRKWSWWECREEIFRLLGDRRAA